MEKSVYPDTPKPMQFCAAMVEDMPVYESTGVLAGRDSTTWYEGNTVQAAIGQSDNAFTPVQLATYASAIANNGVRYRTHLVRKIMNYERDETVLYNDPENYGNKDY